LRRAKSTLAVVISLAVIVGGMGFVAWQGYGLYQVWQQRDDYIGEGDDPVQIVIEPGSGWSTVADLLLFYDVVQDGTLFQEEALKLADGPETAGTWKLKTHLPAQVAAKMLVDTKNLVTMTWSVREGLWTADLKDMMVEQVGPTVIKQALPQVDVSYLRRAGVTATQFDQALEAAKADPAAIGLNPAAGGNPEGFLFPANYDLNPPIGSDALSILRRMAEQFTTVAETLDMANKAQNLGVDLQDAVTIASIIEAEVNRDEDRAKVARVIYNRLAAGMLVQMDSVVNYGLGRKGIVRLTAEDLAVDTPYNIYMHTGLPPTPINNPGRAALEAAVTPADGDWLYFTTIDLITGETRFESTLEEHDANVAILDQWCVDNPGYC
jgi:UPF0755 protein